jgi:hypothetical protein
MSSLRRVVPALAPVLPRLGKLRVMAPHHPERDSLA